MHGKVCIVLSKYHTVQFQDLEFYGEPAIAAGWGRYVVWCVQYCLLILKHRYDEERGQSKELREVKLKISSKRYKHNKVMGTELKKNKAITMM